MVDPIFALDDQDFFCHDASPLVLPQPQQKTPDTNQHLISHPYQVLLWVYSIVKLMGRQVWPLGHHVAV